MSYPDTTDQALARILERVRRGGDIMRTEAQEHGEDAERRTFRLAAQAGAERYAEVLAAQIEAGRISDQLMREAELVARATECAGWLSAAVNGEPARALTDQGVFAYYPAVPGKYVACYRLVAGS